MKRRSLLALVVLLVGCEASIVVGRVRLGSDAGADAARDAGADAGATCATPLVASRLATGETHSCAIAGGAVYCWGSDDSGQLGDADTVDRDRPVAVVNGTGFAEVTVTGHTSCATRADTTLFCWGNNFSGLLADGTDQGTSTPVPTIAGVVQARLGPSYALTLDASGLLTVWGENTDGQLGLGPASVGMIHRTETPLVGSDYAGLATGSHHACVLDAGGHPSCAGDAINGQLGMPGGSRDTFTALPTALTFDHLDADYDHTCGVTLTGALYCWGLNSPALIAGQPGVVAAPTRIGTESDYTEVSVGFDHACAIRSGGRLVCWGDNAKGEVGTANELEPTPVEITPGIAYAAVSAGWDHTCAIRAADSVVVCMGVPDSRLGRGSAASTALEPVCLP